MGDVPGLGIEFYLGGRGLVVGGYGMSKVRRGLQSKRAEIQFSGLSVDWLVDPLFSVTCILSRLLPTDARLAEWMALASLSQGWCSRMILIRTVILC